MPAEPTLRDVFDVLTSLDTKLEVHRKETADRFDAVDKNLEAHGVQLEANRAELEALRKETEAHRAQTEAHRAQTEAHRAETAKGFAELDRELARHADPVHRDLERRVTALETAAARPPPGPHRARRRG